MAIITVVQVIVQVASSVGNHKYKQSVVHVTNIVSNQHKCKKSQVQETSSASNSPAPAHGGTRGDGGNGPIAAAVPVCARPAALVLSGDGMKAPEFHECCKKSTYACVASVGARSGENVSKHIYQRVERQ